MSSFAVKNIYHDFCCFYRHEDIIPFNTHVQVICNEDGGMNRNVPNFCTLRGQWQEELICQPGMPNVYMRYLSAGRAFCNHPHNDF